MKEEEHQGICLYSGGGGADGNVREPVRAGL